MAAEDPAAAYRSRLSDFRILRELGSGSWGTVYEAERHADGGVYALKRIALAHRSRRDQMAAVSEAQVGERGRKTRGGGELERNQGKPSLNCLPAAADAGGPGLPLHSQIL